MLLICTIAPEPWRRRCGSTARVSAAGPKKCNSIRSLSSRSVVSSTAPTRPRPALLTSTSIRPYQRMVSATTAAARTGSVTSSWTATARSGYAEARSSSTSGLRTAATTVSPAASAASAIARPNPDDAPVISQTRPVAARVGVLLSVVICCSRGMVVDAFRYSSRRPGPSKTEDHWLDKRGL